MIKCDNMKNAILFNYNLDAKDINEIPNGSVSFYIDYIKYYLMRVKRPNKDIEEIYTITKEYPNNFYTIIKNKDNSIFTKIDDVEYILIRISGAEHNEIDLEDILSYTIPYENKSTILNRTNWGDLWSEKVDYLEYQVSELATEHPIIKGSFSYYIGLAENAIQYFNSLDPRGANTHISHRRIKENLDSLHFYDPLDIVIDYLPRDIASFIKIKFFQDKDEALRIVDRLIQKKILSPLEYNLLFCRLLYPSYYFDTLTRVLEDKDDEKNLLKFIDNVDEYERFLNDVFHRFETVSSMIKIDWLIKEAH